MPTDNTQTMLSTCFEKLSAALPGRFFVGQDVKQDYSHDEKAMYCTGLPAAAAEPVSTEEVAMILKVCSSEGVGVTVRGAGTGLCGGSVAVDGGILLSMNRMNKIISVDKENMTLTTQPGVSLQDVISVAAAEGMYYAPDPGEKTASIGGNVSTNAGGPRASRYGSTRDNVLAVTAVTPGGETLRLGGSVIKDNSGLNLMQLLIGSEGTLAVITEIVLRLLPVKKYDISFILPYESIEDAAAAARAIRFSGLDPVSAELMPDDIIKFSAAFTGEHIFPEDCAACLLVSFDAPFEDWLDSIMEKFAEIAEETNPSDILVVDTPTLKNSVWAAHAAMQTAIESGVKRFDESDCVVPVSALGEYMASVRVCAQKAGLNVLMYAHAMDGSLHIFVYNDELSPDEFSAADSAFMTESYQVCSDMGGKLSGEHGIGFGKKQYQNAIEEKNIRLLQESVKAAFDPAGILNRGKKF